MSDFVEKMIDIKLSYEIDITHLKNDLKKKTDHLKIINDFIRKYCKHLWIHDYIDIDVERGMNITYCKFCELSPTK